MKRSEEYKTLGELGRGGMSVVHRVKDPSLLRHLALKRIHSDAADDPERLQRFLEEARITGQLDHPNIVPIHELGEDGEGSWFFTMKLVQGKNLEEIVDELGENRLAPESLAELLQVFVRTCEAVAFAHSRGVIHRDLKPANIMVGEFGQVYIMDWGVARVLPWALGSEQGVQLVQDEERPELDTVGVVVGTPCYMAPEQVEGLHEETDERTDVFNLGATLYHVLAGQAPYQGGNYYTLMVAALHCNVQPPEEIVEGDRIPGELLSITRRAMAPKPEDRYASVMDLKRDVERFLNGAWHLPVREFSAGEDIVSEGDEGAEAFIITRGRCVVLKQADGGESELRRLGPGEVFGEMAIFSPGQRSATVRALEKVTVMVVDQDTLTRGLGLNSWMGRFVTALTDRFREVEKRLREVEEREP